MKHSMRSAGAVVLASAVAMVLSAGASFADSGHGSPGPASSGSAAAAVPGPGFDSADTALSGGSSGSRFPAAATRADDVVLSTADSTPVAAVGAAVTHTIPWYWTVDFTHQLTSDPFVTTSGTVCVNFKATHHSPADTSIDITLQHNGSDVGGPVSYKLTGGPWQYCYHGQSTSGSYRLFFQKIENGQQVTGTGSVKNHS